MRVFRLLPLLFALASCSKVRQDAASSGNPNDEFYKEQRAKRADFTGSANINVCAEQSSKCYTLVASVNHHFDEKGKENTTVDKVQFDNGGYLKFDNAPLPGTGIDQRGKTWSLNW